MILKRDFCDPIISWHINHSRLRLPCPWPFCFHLAIDKLTKTRLIARRENLRMALNSLLTKHEKFHFF